MLRYFLWVLLFTRLSLPSLYAEDENTVPPDDPFASSLVKTQNLISTFVNSVSAISGDWIHSETDIAVLGPEPLILNRYYSGNRTHDDKLGYNWDFSRPHKLIVDVNEKKVGHPQVLARLHHTSGISTIHKAETTDSKLEKTVVPLLLSGTRGLTNCRGEICGKTNLNNTVIQFDYKGKQCAAISGSGHLTYYELFNQKYRPQWNSGTIGTGYYEERLLNHYRPVYERKPNGNEIHFKKGEISSTNSSKAANPQIFGTLHFLTNSLEELRIEASDGRWAEYHFSTYDHMLPGVKLNLFVKDRFCLSEAKFSHKPDVHYQYTQNPPSRPTEHLKFPLLLAKHLPQGRYQKVEYYGRGDNVLDMSSEKREIRRKIEIDSQSDFRVDRVKVIKAPVGHDDSPIITHRFVYEANTLSKTVKKSKESFSGLTKVYDAYLRKTVYEYNQEHRPIKIQRYAGKELYSEECYSWDDRYFFSSSFRKKVASGSPNGGTANELYARVEKIQNEDVFLLKSLKGNLFSPLKRDFAEEADEEEIDPGFFTTISSALNTVLSNRKPLTKNEERLALYKACSRAKILQTGGTGNLLGKYVRDHKGAILFAHFFDYDKKGNIIRNRFYGNLTGKNSRPVVMDLHNKPQRNGCEYYEKRFTYSLDHYNLLMSETEDNGKGILYEYYPETDLASAKYVTENGVIRQRQFFHYDGHATLIKIVKDDGSEREEKNWKSISERQVTYIHPRGEAPFGLPACIEHKYVDDLQCKSERLLKKICSFYSREGHLTQEDHYDAGGNYRYSLYWDFDAHGNVIREVNALGEEIIKDYDANDNLILERGPQPGTSKRFTYDFANRLIRTRYREGKNIWFCFYKYDWVGNRVAEIDRHGNETNFEYDDFNRLVRTLYPAITEEGSRPSTATVFDAFDHPIKEIDAGGYETNKTYNANGKPLKIRHPDGQVERFEYNKEGTLAKKTASNGTSIDYLYDCFGRLLSEKAKSQSGDFLYETSHTYNSFHKTSSTDASGLTTYFEYDLAGRLVKTTAEDKTEIYEYNLFNRIAKKKIPFAHQKMRVECTEYDLLDRVIEERIEDENGEILKKISYAYDSYGNRTDIIEETAGGPSRQTTLFNRDKKPVKIIDAMGNKTRIVYGEVKNSLDQLVLQTISTDPLGRQTIVICDALERPVTIKRQDMNGVLLAHQELLYNVQGHLIRLIDRVIVHGVEVHSVETAFEYQAMGQMTCQVLAKGLPEQRITRIKYDSLGQKEKETKSDGTILYHTYDALGRLDSYYSSDQSIHYRYHYNPRHQIVQAEDLVQKASTFLEYDARGRLKQETLATGLKIAYDYDPLDRPTCLILPDSSCIHYSYDALHLRQVDRHKYGQLLYSQRYDDFDKAGLSLKSTTILQDEVKRSYDPLKRPLAVESRLFEQNEVDYDPAGRLRRCRTQDPIGSFHTKMEYDDNDHLVMEEGHRTHVYTCDSLHNRLSKNHVSHTSNGLHQLIHNGEWSYRYDEAGNLKAKEKENETTLYRYDALDRLIAVETAGKKIGYTYDPFNRRVAKILNGQTTSFLYAGQNEIGSVNDSGQIEELRVLGQSHGAEIGASIALELHGQIFAPSHDFQGNIVSLADAAGNPKETYRYTSFGEPTIYNGEGQEIPSSQSINPWRYSGKRADEETGFVYFGRRYYDPANGRWITADPSGLDDGPNLYAYLHHSPLQAFDFYGLEEEPNYPLRNVDFHDKSPHPSQEKRATSSEQEAPLGFVEKKKTKSDRMFFCGLQQIGDLGISCVNGIMNNLKDANANARALSEMADDHYVTFVHNPSKGLIPDLIRCFFELYFYMNTEAVKNLQSRWDAHFLHANPGSFLYHECHSEGAIITRNALMGYPEELRNRIIVVAIAPGAYIDDKYAHSVTHYRSTADIVPLFDFAGALRCSHSTVVLKPHHDASFFDHSISSPTYQDVREFKLDSYIKQYGNLACAQ